MNPTAIEWTHCFGPGTGFTWNPIVGCSGGCSYCYARRQMKRQKHNCELCYQFVPHLHPERLDQPLHRKKPAGIFVGSVSDLWGPEVPQEWRDLVWDICRQTPEHRYFALTKQPQNIWEPQDIPKNVRVGVSASDEATADAMINALVERTAAPCIISIEPLLGRVGSGAGALGATWKRDWVIIGAQTGPGAFVPPAEWVDEIIVEAKHSENAAVFVKDNLRALYPERRWPREWPDPEVCDVD